MQEIDLSIIIVSWNVSDLMKACLESIFSGITTQEMHGVTEKMAVVRKQVIVVDSASTDNTIEMLRRDFPHVEIITETENVGFTRGNNIGLEASRGRHVMLLNPDTVVLASALEEMVYYLDRNPNVGIVGPYTLNTDGSTQSTRRRFPTRAVALVESTWLQPLAPKMLLDKYYMRDLPLQATVDVDWVQGSALMARREVYEQIGGLDEGYVMYSEEMDWCKRAKLAGWRVVFVATAQIIHHGGKSTDQIAAQKHIYFQESKLRYFRKYHGDRFAAQLRLFLLLNYYWQIGIESVKSWLGSKREMRRNRIQEYWQVIRSGLKVT